MAPNIQLNLTPAEINKAVAEAIVNSTLGDLITQRVKEITQDYQLKNQVNLVIENTVRSRISDIIMSNYSDKIKELAKEALSDELLNGIITKAIERLRY